MDGARMLTSISLPVVCHIVPGSSCSFHVSRSGSNKFGDKVLKRRPVVLTKNNDETQDIKPGDVLEQVDAKIISSATRPAQINELIRGSQGRKLNITMMRRGEKWVVEMLIYHISDRLELSLRLCMKIWFSSLDCLSLRLPNNSIF